MLRLKSSTGVKNSLASCYTSRDRVKNSSDQSYLIGHKRSANYQRSANLHEGISRSVKDCGKTIAASYSRGD